MPTRMRIRPAAKVKLPSQSILAGVRTPRSSSFGVGPERAEHPEGHRQQEDEVPLHGRQQPAQDETDEALPRWRRRC